MGKKVIYNGGKRSYKGSTGNTNLLVKGKMYEVESIYDLGWQTNYKLKEVEGEFNSLWFDKPEYMVSGESLPNVGECMICKLIDSGRMIKTSRVQSVENVGNYVYKVSTTNSIFFLKLDK